MTYDLLNGCTIASEQMGICCENRGRGVLKSLCKVLQQKPECASWSVAQIQTTEITLGTSTLNGLIAERDRLVHIISLNSGIQAVMMKIEQHNKKISESMKFPFNLKCNSCRELWRPVTYQLDEQLSELITKKMSLLKELSEIVGETDISTIQYILPVCEKAIVVSEKFTKEKELSESFRKWVWEYEECLHDVDVAKRVSAETWNHLEVCRMSDDVCV